jgi:hypothetical protein
MTTKIMTAWCQQQEAELEEEEEEQGQLQAWATNQLGEFQKMVNEEELSAQHARHLAEQFQAQMAAQAHQEKQDALAAAALAAAEDELRQQQAANQAP